MDTHRQIYGCISRCRAHRYIYIYIYASEVQMLSGMAPLYLFDNLCWPQRPDTESQKFSSASVEGTTCLKKDCGYLWYSTENSSWGSRKGNLGALLPSTGWSMWISWKFNGGIGFFGIHLVKSRSMFPLFPAFPSSPPILTRRVKRSMLRPGVCRSDRCSLAICCTIVGAILPHAHWFTAQIPHSTIRQESLCRKDTHRQAPQKEKIFYY